MAIAYDKCLLMMNVHCCDEGPQDIQISQTTKVRSFPHVDGNYALHVYIPSKLTLSQCWKTLFCFVIRWLWYLRDLI